MRQITLVLIALLWLMGQAKADENLLMVRSEFDFNTTLERVTQSIQEHGYTVAHIQKCDGGLKLFGYQTDRYRIIFFGKGEEVRKLSRRYPEVVPFLPLKIAVYAEEKESLVVALNPEELSGLFRSKVLKTQFRRWKSDYVSILADVKKTR